MEAAPSFNIIQGNDADANTDTDFTEVFLCSLLFSLYFMFVLSRKDTPQNEFFYYVFGILIVKYEINSPSNEGHQNIRI